MNSFDRIVLIFGFSIWIGLAYFTIKTGVLFTIVSGDLKYLSISGVGILFLLLISIITGGLLNEKETN